MGRVKSSWVKKEFPDVNKGLLCHTQLAVTTEGVPLGLIGQKIWSRKKHSKTTANEESKRNRKTPLKQKESYKWVECLEQGLQTKTKSRVVHVGDREADLFDFIFRAQELSENFVIRAAYNRKIIDEDHKWMIDKVRMEGAILL